MRREDHLFMDVVVHRPVYRYVDSCGRSWMATSSMSWGRVEYPHQDMKALELEMKDIL